jgi:hypothetical protein
MGVCERLGREIEKKFTNNCVEQLDERKCSECYKLARPKNNPTEKMLTL